LSLPDCDGVLVGAASLNYHQFASIVDSAYQLVTERTKNHA
jgi:triosephosphate isomerase